MLHWLTLIFKGSALRVPVPLFIFGIFMAGCATPKSAVDYIDGTEVGFAPVVTSTDEDVSQQRLNIAIGLFNPGVALEPLENEENVWMSTDNSGTTRIDEKAVNPKIRRLETHYFPAALKHALDKSNQWGNTFVSPGAVQSPDIYISGVILASDGYAIAIHVQAKDSTGRTWYEDTLEYETQEWDYLNAKWPERDPYDAIFNHIANELSAYRDLLTVEEERNIRRVSQMRFAGDLAPDAFGNYLAQDEDSTLELLRFPANSDPNFQIVRQLQGAELEMLTYIEEYYDNLFEGAWDPYSTWREQFRQLSIEIEQYRVQAENQKTASLVTGLLMVAAAAASGSSAYEEGNTHGVIQSAAILVGGLELSAAMYEAAREKIAIANLKAKEMVEISDIAGEGMQPKVIELEGRTYQLTGDVESRFRQIRGIIRNRYLIETGQEDLAPDDSFGSL